MNSRREEDKDVAGGELLLRNYERKRTTEYNGQSTGPRPHSREANVWKEGAVPRRDGNDDGGTRWTNASILRLHACSRCSSSRIQVGNNELDGRLEDEFCPNWASQVSLLVVSGCQLPLTDSDCTISVSVAGCFIVLLNTDSKLCTCC